VRREEGGCFLKILVECRRTGQQRMAHLSLLTVNGARKSLMRLGWQSAAPDCGAIDPAWVVLS
jgi:hypothetical protein